MKKILIFVFTVFIITLIGCSNEKEYDLKQLNRVDVQIFTGENTEKEKIIMDEEKMKALRDLFAKIEWEYNVKAQMDRKEDMKATLFFTLNKDMPEKLVEYFIWFDTSVTIVNREKNSLGKLNKEDSKKLIDILMKN
ncbi:hypothetical protein V1498_12165 [Peribacillus sp. SCS-26]|uniref:hypothetical protein n=1 Tax=Paraperibacillus marinus TaxID=3115295 RepID=UPI003905F624